METKKIIKSPWIFLGIFMVVLILILLFLVHVAFLLPDKLIDNSTTMTCYFGIAILTLLVGILLLAGLVIWQLFALLKNAQKQVEKDAEHTHKMDYEKLLCDEAEKRRNHERILNRASDLAKLIEAGKVKNEIIDEKSDVIEQLPITKQTTITKHTEKPETPNSDIYKSIIEEYFSSNNTHPNIEPNV